MGAFFISKSKGQVLDFLPPCPNYILLLYPVTISCACTSRLCAFAKTNSFLHLGQWIKLFFLASCCSLLAIFRFSFSLPEPVQTSPFLCKTENSIQRKIKFAIVLARKFVKKIILILCQIYPLSPVKLFITLWIMWITSLEEAFLPLNTHLLRPKL